MAGLEHFHLYAVDRVTCNRKRSNCATNECDSTCDARTKDRLRNLASLGNEFELTLDLSTRRSIGIYRPIEVSTYLPSYLAICSSLSLSLWLVL